MRARKLSSVLILLLPQYVIESKLVVSLARISVAYSMHPSVRLRWVCIASKVVTVHVWIVDAHGEDFFCFAVQV